MKLFTVLKFFFDHLLPSACNVGEEAWVCTCMGVRRGEQGGAFAPPWILGIFYHPCMALMRGPSWVAVCWHRSCLEPLQLCVYSLNIREGLRTIILSNATPANQPTEQYRRIV